MPPKRKRAGQQQQQQQQQQQEEEEEQQQEQVSRPPAGDCHSRRATRQTPVLPPRPGTTWTTTSAAPRTPAAAAATTGSSPVANASSQLQTPVPIPTPPGVPAAARGRGRPQTAARPRLTTSAAVQTRVPVPVVRPASPSSAAAAGQSMSGASPRENVGPADVVAGPDSITCHNVPQPPPPAPPGRRAPAALPPRLHHRPAPPVVTPVLPPKPPTLAVNDRGPPRADRNIDKVVLGNLCFRTWYPSYYGKEVLGGDGALGHVRRGSGSGSGRGSGSGNRDAGQDTSGGGGGNKHSRRDRDAQPAMLERLYVCPSCFKYAKELVAWRGHVRICERSGSVPGKKIYTHPRGRRRVLVAHEGGKGSGGAKRRRGGDGGARYTEEIVQDEGEWSIWEVDGEKNGLFCQNLSLFAKLFLDNKSVFFDVSGFNYFLLVYTPPPAKAPVPGTEPAAAQGRPLPQVTGFFSKEKMSWDNNNLACILVFPPWQRKGLGALLMGASYEMSRREGILGGPEKPISDLGKKGYKRFWSGEISRWLLGLETQAREVQTPTQQQQQQQQRQEGGDDRPAQREEVVVDVNDCSRGTWIAAEDCLSVLREMGVVEDAGMGYGKPGGVGGGEENDDDDDDDEDDDDEAAEDDQASDMTDSAGGQEQDAGLTRSSEDDDGNGNGNGNGTNKTADAAAGLKLVPRVRVDKEAVRRYVARHRISLERTCDPDGFTEGYAVQAAGDGDGDGDGDGGAGGFGYDHTYGMDGVITGGFDSWPDGVSFSYMLATCLSIYLERLHFIVFSLPHRTSRIPTYTDMQHNVLFIFKSP
ncbi:hypothetical protein E4U41_004024 [Claviceps citrina]|nr:hypothetical protein E4U41_004024 [Claviceps citrina]